MFTNEIVELLKKYDKNDYTHPIKRIHNYVNNLKYEGDLIDYIHSQCIDNKRKTYELNKALKETLGENLLDICEKYLNSGMKHFQVEELREFEEYSSYEISSLASNHNITIGMYCKEIDSTTHVFLKATIDGEKYKNRWIIKDKKIKYFGQLDNGEIGEKDFFSHTANQKVYDNLIGEPIKIHIFTRYTSGAKYIYEGLFKCVLLDDEFCFELDKIEDIDQLVEENDKQFEEEINILEKRIQEENDGTIPITCLDGYENKLTQVVKNTMRNGKLQSIFRGNVLRNGQSKCVICETQYLPLLIASHIYPVASIVNSTSFTNKEKLEMIVDYKNGLPLCAIHDALFDKGFISFDDTKHLMISKQLPEYERKLFLPDKNMILKYDCLEKYMTYHRERVFRK